MPIDKNIHEYSRIGDSTWLLTLTVEVGEIKTSFNFFNLLSPCKKALDNTLSSVLSFETWWLNVSYGIFYYRYATTA